MTVTDPEMTRFWITREQGVRFVIKCIERMRGGEVFVPKIPSMRLADVVEVVAPGCEQTIVGMRPGEKMHEALLGAEEAMNAREFEDMYVICPDTEWFEFHPFDEEGEATAPGFQYTSDANSEWLTGERFAEMLRGDS
ncbi:MAG TPA: hypothetical protein EYQ64_15465 [Gemmatimonadetes bacterium]|nr:hypothetical protein [Gemmatimonadota bacterium]